MVSHTTDNNLKLSLSNVNFFCSISLECAKTEIMIIVARDKICLLDISTLKEASPPILDFMKRRPMKLHAVLKTINRINALFSLFMGIL